MAINAVVWETSIICVNHVNQIWLCGNGACGYIYRYVQYARIMFVTYKDMRSRCFSGSNFIMTNVMVMGLGPLG